MSSRRDAWRLYALSAGYESTSAEQVVQQSCEYADRMVGEEERRFSTEEATALQLQSEVAALEDKCRILDSVVAHLKEKAYGLDGTVRELVQQRDTLDADLRRVRAEAHEQTNRALNAEQTLEHVRDELATTQTLLTGSVPMQVLDELVDDWRKHVKKLERMSRDEYGHTISAFQECREALTAIMVEHSLAAKLPDADVPKAEGGVQAELDAQGNFVAVGGGDA